MNKNGNENIYNLFCSAGYYPVEQHPNFKKKVKCIDTDGYIVYPSVKNIRENKQPFKFHASNPDTIHNIKHYIMTNNINIQLESDIFVDAKSKLLFKCFCGNHFETSWSNFRYNNKRSCNECTLGKPSHIVPYEVLIGVLTELNLTPLFSKSDYSGISSTVCTIQNECGYKALATYDLVNHKVIPKWFHKSNPYTIYNINVFFKNTTAGEYECVSKQYLGQDADLNIIHKPCGKTFSAKWENINRKPTVLEPNRHGTQCPYCTGLRTQSLHAVVLKQLFQKLKTGITIEDKSCRNPITKCILPTDIVNHNDRIVVEIQSWFHDKLEQQIKDNIKKTYWESRGYKVYTPDIRNYTVLEMAQIFFPNLKTIPKWVEYNFESKLDVDMAQKMLNSGLLVTEVASKMNVSPHRIYDAIYDKRLRYPNNYKNNNLIKQDYIDQQVTVQTAG